MKKIVLIICVLALIATICLGCAACGLFKGKDAVGISSIEKTGTEGLVDTYTITMTDGSTSTFTVTNGQGSNQLPSDTYTPEHYFRFELLDDETYMVRNRYTDMYPTIVVPSKYNGKAVTKMDFTYTPTIEKFVIPVSITSIDYLKTNYESVIEYKGTKAQWQAILVGSINNVTTIHCTDGDINLD